MAKIGVIGLGHVGLATACGWRQKGYHVVGYDRDHTHVNALRHGEFTCNDRDLAGHLAEMSDCWSSDPACLVDCDWLMVCIGTPAGEEGNIELQALNDWLSLSLQLALNCSLMVLRSTVPVGTTRQLQSRLSVAGKCCDVIYQPEFMREQTALYDVLHPSRIVLGCVCDSVSTTVMRYKEALLGFDSPVLVCGGEEAEMIKLASNAYLSMRISWANQMANLCQVLGLDWPTVKRGMGLDPRIGQFYFRAGLGYGGPCLEKDLAALMAIGEQAKVPLTISQAAQNVNRSQRFWPLQQLQHLYGSGNPLKLMIWGLAYVANGCDLRQSPALETIQILLDAGYERPFFYDPYVSFAAFKAVIPLAEQNQWLDDEQALWHHLPEVDAVLILTGHTIFQSFDLERLDRLMAGRWVIDACGLWEKEEVGVYRFGYAAIGRPPAFPR